ncbi:unnamed protein product [Auanema sp. JU1783]|nr:unnamed protein product [Auanema sp. JU1783]
MADKSTKVLCCGDVNGKFQQLIKKVTAVNNKNGPFDILLCVGEFFGLDQEANEEVVNGVIDFPIPTYVLGPCRQETCYIYPEESVEFSSSLTFLGKRGILNTASGLQIAYLSGVEGREGLNYQFSKSEVQDLLIPVKTQSGFLGVDILLTSVWPEGVATHAHNTPSKPVEGSKLISRLATALKPRYHFAGNGIHYERQPYRNHRVLLEAAQHCTRYIGLADVGNAENQKWIYAFSLKPMKRLSREELTMQPPNSSEFPYMDLLTEMLEEDAAEARVKASTQGSAQFRFDMTEEVDDPVDRGGRKRRGRDGGPSERKQPTGPCWFCLSNNDAEKHLVVSVGDTCYVAMPKGPLVEDHVMILTIGHIQSLIAASEEVQAEVEKFKNAFILMADKAGKALVAFERNYCSQHLQIQLVPVPKSSVKALRGAFMNAASIAGFELTHVSDNDRITDIVNEGCPYFFVELPDGSRLFTRQMKNFPLQFGREVLAGSAVLDCEDKIDWRAAVLDKENETKLTKKLQERFKPFDFTADDDSD